MTKKKPNQYIYILVRFLLNVYIIQFYETPAS